MAVTTEISNMKKVLMALSLVALLSTGVGYDTYAAHAQVDAEVRVEVEADNNTGGNRQDDAAQNNERGNSGTRGASMTASSTGQLNAEERRSDVASSVQSLLSIADRDGGIGAEVRAVAQAQQESASTTAEARAKVEGRSAVMTFLFGSDWKNLGSLRSETAKIDANIQKLEAALARTANASVRTDLEAQIVALEDQREELATFISKHESSFSLFGWFTKLFAQAEA